MPYADYLSTPYWRRKREGALARAGGRCQVCNSSARLEVHHRDYARRGYEDAADLIVLCSGCHDLFHEQRRLARYGPADRVTSRRSA
jgi:5-methylcytosine-specific restriction endonuclease McrA